MKNNHTKTQLLFLIIFTSLFSFTYGQNTNCNILNVALKDSLLIRKLYLNDSSKSAIVIIDKNKYFNKCRFDSSINKKVIVVQGSSTEEKRNKSDVIIKNLIRNNGVYKLEVYQEDSQASGYVLFKLKNGKYLIVKSAIGNF
jgi:hypothetical protein